MGSMSLTEKILEVLKQLVQEDVYEMLSFDVKDGKEPGGKTYQELYMGRAKREMKSLDWAPYEDWKNMTPWQKLCIYKVSDDAGVDCDVALRNVVLYALAYGLMEEGWKIEEQSERKWHYQLRSQIQPTWVLRGDTMNSYATTIHAYIHRAIGTIYWDELLRRKIIDPERTRCGMLNMQDHYYYKAGTKTKNPWERAVLLNYDIFQRAETPALQSFFRSVHTLGNFVPVPFCSNAEGAFNGPRGLGLSKDYWDLALVCIYNYYAQKAGHLAITWHGKNIYTLEWMLRARDRDPEKRDYKTSANVDLCKDWLDGFDTWSNFVKKNFFQDYVWETETSWGKPKELWTGHFEGSTEPKLEPEFQEMFSRGGEWSKNRGKKIAMAAKEKLTAQNLEQLAKRMTWEDA